MRFFSRLCSVTVITVSNGSAVATKGQVPRAVLDDVAMLCRDTGINKAEIWIAGDGQRSFSAEIPIRIHQQMRNVLGSV